MKNKILDEIVENTEKLMKCVTVKENYKEFDKAFNIIKKELKDYYIEEIIVNKYKNLVISNTKDHNLDVIFCGHVDVVINDTYEPAVSNGCLYGRGSFDMKGQLSVMISLLKNNKINKKIALIITSDEEIGGQCCKEIIKDYNAKFAVIPDAGTNFKLIVEEKGLFQLEIITPGITAHASEPFKGENAILKSISIYNKLLEKNPLPKDDKEFITSINLSKIEGGKSINTVADISKMTLDIRFTNEITKEKIISDIKEISKESEIKILDWGPTFYVNPNNKYIEKFKCNAKKILGRDLIIDRCLATSDAIYFSEKNIPCILINPNGNYWHNPKEYVEIDSLYTLYLLFETLI